MHHEVIELASDLHLHRFGDEEVSTLVVQRGHALLVECHDPQVAAAINAMGLPWPEGIMHTHVQPEHCQPGDELRSVPVVIPAGLEVVAESGEAFWRQAATKWDDPNDWMNTLGREALSIGGALTYAPLPKPLNMTGVLRGGDTWSWQGLTWKVIALPGHMAEAVGLVLSRGGRALACFIGDLMRGPGVLVNLYDLEHAYGVTRLPQLPALLRKLADEVDTDLYVPATGPVLRDGRAAARRLASGIEYFLQAVEAPVAGHQPVPVPAQQAVGRFEQVARGVYQFQQPGNAIVFIDSAGRGLMIDPGPCDYGNPRRQEDFLEDIAALEQQAGLRCIDQVLVTHMHGDHYDMLPLVQARYPGCRAGAWDPLARLIERPEAYPYACLLPWYGLGLHAMTIDDRLRRNAAFHWHDVPIRTVHLPGHCLVHAGYILDFAGRRWAVTGDTIMSDGSAMALGYVMANHGAPTGGAGMLTAVQTMLAEDGIDVNLCGHGLRFANCRATYRATQQRVQRAVTALEPLVHGDLERAATRRWYPAVGDVIAEQEPAATS